MKVRQFRILKEQAHLDDPPEVGEVVYKCNLNDYGLKSDDERILGVECINLTRDPEGGYPFFVVQRGDVEEVHSEMEG